MNIPKHKLFPVKRITYGGLIIALAILLPQAFHLTGVTAAGEVFLPMHIPVLVGGFALGPMFGGVIGIISPILSSLITGMPMHVRLPFMILELGAYGFMSGFLYNHFRNKKLGIHITLIASMLFGRLVFALSLLIAGDFLGLTSLGGIAFAATATVRGLYGIIIQLLFIPAFIFALEKSGFLERRVKN